MTKKAKTKKTGRPQTAKHDAKPRQAATHAHAKSSTKTEPVNHLTHVADPIVMAVIDSVSALAEEPSHAEPVAHAKQATSDGDAKRHETETNAPSLFARVVRLVSGVADAILPKKLVLRKHAH